MVFFRSRAAHRANAYGEGSQPRGRQGPADYDVFEGLPVRRWARQTFVVSQTPKSVDPDGQLGWMQNPSELPMPKDSHLLSPASRALLSSVRAGCKYVKAPERSNRDGGDAKDANGPDGKLAVPFARTFTVGRWAALPRHMDPPEPEYLAKRRSNFVPMTGLTGTGSDFISAGNAKLRRTKFKRTDPATGTVMVYDAAVPEGHTVEGEVTKDEHTAQQPKEGTIATPSPGTVIEGVGIVDPGGVVIANVDEVLVTPIPRRRFPPKRKFRGAGRGRRKKVMFAHGGGEGYGGGGHQTMSASGLDPTSASGADNSGRPEDHPTPNGHDDDLDGDNDNYGDESDEDEEMTDRPDSDVHVVEEQQKDLKEEEGFQQPADTTTVDHQPVVPDRVDCSAEEKPPNVAADNIEESFTMPFKPDHITEKPPSPDPSYKPSPNETPRELHNGIKSEAIQHSQPQAEEPQQDRPEATPIQEPNPQTQSQIEPQSELQPEHQLEAQPETQPEIQPEPSNELHQGSPREELPPSPLRFDDGDLDLLGNFDPSTDPAPGRDENEKEL